MIVKPVWLALPVLTAGLLLLLATFSDEYDSPGRNLASVAPLASQDQLAARKADRLSLPPRREPGPIGQDPVSGPMDTPPPRPPTVGLSMLYPQFGRIAALEDLPAGIAIEALTPMLYDADPAIRLAALESLADTRHPSRIPLLTSALDDPHPLIRIGALEALSLVEDDGVASFVEARLQDPDPEVRMTAIDTLGELENEYAVHGLAGLLGDPDAAIRRHAVNALGEIGGESASLYLEQMRHDPDASIRASAGAILREDGLQVDY